MADEAVGEPPADGENGEVNPEEEEEEVLPPPCELNPIFVNKWLRFGIISYLAKHLFQIQKYNGFDCFRSLLFFSNTYCLKIADFIEDEIEGAVEYCS